MSRPTLGTQAKTRVLSVRITQQEHDIITATGLTGTRYLRLLLDQAMAEATTGIPNPARTTTPHRHKRQRTGDHWAGGTNVGTWQCATCSEPLDP